MTSPTEKRPARAAPGRRMPDAAHATTPGSTVQRAMADIAADRPCLCCGKTFPSEGFGQRICRRCKGSSIWRSAVAEGVSTGRQRGARSS